MQPMVRYDVRNRKITSVVASHRKVISTDGHSVTFAHSRDIKRISCLKWLTLPYVDTICLRCWLYAENSDILPNFIVDSEHHHSPKREMLARNDVLLPIRVPFMLAQKKYLPIRCKPACQWMAVRLQTFVPKQFLHETSRSWLPAWSSTCLCSMLPFMGYLAASVWHISTRGCVTTMANIILFICRQKRIC